MKVNGACLENAPRREHSGLVASTWEVLASLITKEPCCPVTDDANKCCLHPFLSPPHKANRAWALGLFGLGLTLVLLLNNWVTLARAANCLKSQCFILYNGHSKDYCQDWMRRLTKRARHMVGALWKVNFTGYFVSLGLLGLLAL